MGDAFFGIMLYGDFEVMCEGSCSAHNSKIIIERSEYMQGNNLMILP